MVFHKPKIQCTILSWETINCWGSREILLNLLKSKVCWTYLIICHAYNGVFLLTCILYVERWDYYWTMKYREGSGRGPIECMLPTFFVGLRKTKSSSSSSSSCRYHAAGPSVELFRSHTTRSLFNGLFLFLLPFSVVFFIIFLNAGGTRIRNSRKIKVNWHV